jgi:hypothetical protein
MQTEESGTPTALLLKKFVTRMLPAKYFRIVKLQRKRCMPEVTKGWTGKTVEEL